MKKAGRTSLKKRKIEASDLFGLNIATSIAMSPTESQVAYIVERIDSKENKYYSNIFMYDNKLKACRPFTQGKQGDSSLAWSRDGSKLAFISTRDKKTGIYAISATGGAEHKLIEIDGSINDLQWTPDGKSLLFSLRYNDSHYIEDEKKKKDPPVYRHITRLFYRLDDLGFLPKDTSQIYTLELLTLKLRKITHGARDNFSAHLSDDGTQVCYLSNRAKNQDLESLRIGLFVIPFKGGKERLIPTPAGPIHTPRFSPNGKIIAYIGHDNPNDGWGVTNLHVWTVGVHGSPKAKDLLPGFDRMVVDQSISDLSDVHDSSSLFWSRDGKRLFFLSSDTGNTNFYYVPVGGGRPTRIFKGDCHLKGLSVNGATKTAALIYADLKTPGEIMLCPTVYGGESKAINVTNLNPHLQTELRIANTKEFRFTSFDETEVQGFLVTPPDFNPTKKYPAVLMIHGGPRVQYAYTFFHEFQFLAAQGFVVLYTNPRGGSGRGETWADAIAGGWGDLDYKDVMAAADWLEKQKFVNPKKIGVGGGSYGGYMTNWLIGHTNRFAAAITMRSVVDLNSFVGSSDIGYELAREFAGFPWTNHENYQKCSPLSYLHKVKTPVLIIHNENDLRCGIEQAEQMFVKLKVLGKTVEFVRFPEESHGLSRHGRPDRRIARLEWIAKWFKRYLK
ncbi:MAG: S9 family peptidase [candidate division Zixibacteria bacterium]|nr:S9 family peptidase [candidate division Zixibacteria bacterium]